MTANLTPEQLVELKLAFGTFDEDGDGMISLSELRHVLSNIIHIFTEEEIQNLMNQVDTDGSISLDFEEFINLVKKLES